MNYLLANLVCEQFPETARVLYGLSKQEFQTEPEITFLASKHGLLQAASALGHVKVVNGFLTNQRLNTMDITNAFVAAYEGRQFSIMVILMNDVRFDRTIPSGMVGCADPFLAWAGLTEEQCKEKGIAYTKGLFPWAASGRAIANGRSEGFTKLLFDETTHRIIGGGIVGTNAGDLIGEICLAIEMGADAVDIGKTIHPHPTLGESVGLAAEVAHGSCTDLPPVRKK